MKMTKYLLIAVLAVSITGCSLFNTKPCPPTTDFVMIPPDKTPELNLKPVHIEVWNQTRLAEEAAKPGNKDNIFYVLRPDQATNLFDNLADISDLTLKSLQTNEYYKDSVEEYQKDKATKAAEAEKDKGKTK